MFDWVSLILGILLGGSTGGLITYLLLQKKLFALNGDLNKAQEAHQQLTQQLQQQQTETNSLKDQFKIEFENLANQILERNTQKLSAENQTTLNHLLSPLKERITFFEKRVEETYQQEARERFSLRREIEKLVTLNHQMSADAQNLTRALTGDSKIQGNWGELVLATVLESSGLREGEEFILQGKEMNLMSPDGRRLQPDVIIKLPDSKHLIIDAKVSLTAYNRYVEAQEEATKLKALRHHLDSVTNHISQLSEKHYAGLKGVNSPDFVLLFMPIEPAFSVAIQKKSDLFSFAWERKIVLVSPTTLLATLRTVASIWKLEQQNQNALEIARQGGALYDKFVGFVKEIDKIGLQLDRTTKIYADVMNKLHTGHGNLIGRAERLRELGVKHNKRLPS